MECTHGDVNVKLRFGMPTGTSSLSVTNDSKLNSDGVLDCKRSQELASRETMWLRWWHCLRLRRIVAEVVKGLRNLAPPRVVLRNAAIWSRVELYFLHSDRLGERSSWIKPG